MRDSVRLNFLEKFLVTFPSISSQNWEMYSWAISGSSVFYDWLFFVFSGVSLETAANFLLFLNVAIILRKSSVSCEGWINFLIYNQSDDLLHYEGKGFQRKQTVNDFRKWVQ